MNLIYILVMLCSQNLERKYTQRCRLHNDLIEYKIKIMKEKDIYESPKIEIVEFEIEEAIAMSTQGWSFFGTLGSEEIWGE